MNLYNIALVWLSKYDVCIEEIKKYSILLFTDIQFSVEKNN